MNQILEHTMPDAREPQARAATAHVIALSELHDHGDGGRPHVVSDSANPLHQIKTRLQVCVGEMTLTVGELMAAKEHQVFVLDRAIDRPVDVLLEGRIVARGQLVAVEDQFAVRITELPVPLKP
jgi:flagellar motor switch protein FliN/FliY